MILDYKDNQHLCSKFLDRVLKINMVLSGIESIDIDFTFILYNKDIVKENYNDYVFRCIFDISFSINRIYNIFNDSKRGENLIIGFIYIYPS